MDFRELNFRGTQMPIIVAEEGIMEYSYRYCNFNVILPFNQEDYDRIQKVPYILYFPETNTTLMVTYYEGIKIESSADINCNMIIEGAEGISQDSLRTQFQNSLEAYIAPKEKYPIVVTDDPVPYSFNSNYEEELLSDKDMLRPWDNKEEDKENEEWGISWDTEKESQDDIIDW